MSDLTEQLERFLAKGRDLPRGTWAVFHAKNPETADRFCDKLRRYAPNADEPSSVTCTIDFRGTDEEPTDWIVNYRVGRKRGPAPKPKES